MGFVTLTTARRLNETNRKLYRKHGCPCVAPSTSTSKEMRLMKGGPSDRGLDVQISNATIRNSLAAMGGSLHGHERIYLKNPPHHPWQIFKRGELEGGLFLTSPTPFTQHSPQLQPFTLGSPTYMAYYNPNDYTLYSTHSASQGLDSDAYQFQSQAPGIGEFSHQADELLASLWGMDAWPPVSISWTGNTAMGNHGNYHRNVFGRFLLTLDAPEPVAPATSYAGGVDSWPQLSYAQSCGHTIGLQAQPEHTGHLGLGTPFVSGMPGPSSGKDLLHLTTSRDVMLTNHEQSHLTTGVKIKAGHLLARLTW